jgi:hypothetical protein
MVYVLQFGQRTFVAHIALRLAFNPELCGSTVGYYAISGKSFDTQQQQQQMEIDIF